MWSQLYLIEKPSISERYAFLINPREVKGPSALLTPTLFFFFLKYLFIYVAVLGLSYIVGDLSLWLTGLVG